MTVQSTPQRAVEPSGLPVSFTLKDGRSCTIRETVEDDAAELCEMLPKMHAESPWLNYKPGEFNKTVEQEKRFIREHTKPSAMMLVALVGGKIVATGGVGSPEQIRLSHHAELGLAVLKDFWNVGIGRKMMELLIQWGRDRNLRKLYLRVYDGNDRAMRLYDALGFQHEARLRDDFQRDDGTYADTIIMSRFLI